MSDFEKEEPAPPESEPTPENEAAIPPADEEPLPPEAAEVAAEEERAAALTDAEQEEPEPAEPPKELPPEAVALCKSAIEAMLFSSRDPIGSRKLAEPLKDTGIDSRGVRRIIAQLMQEYADSRRGFAIEEVAGGFRMVTRTDYAEYVSRLQGESASARLSQAALETLAVIAYKQPVARADIEAIRGVQAGPLLRALLQKGLVKITGRAEILGRPLLYGTTKKFLEYFGLKSLNELPRVEELPKP